MDCTRSKYLEAFHNSTFLNAEHIVPGVDLQRLTISSKLKRPFVVDYRPINSRLSSEPNCAVVNATINITCSAQANPPAKYRFYKEQESLFNTTTGSDAGTYTTSAGERVRQVNFGCIPFNEYGDGPKEMITITVRGN